MPAKKSVSKPKRGPRRKLQKVILQDASKPLIISEEVSIPSNEGEEKKPVTIVIQPVMKKDEDNKADVPHEAEESKVSESSDQENEEKGSLGSAYDKKEESRMPEESFDEEDERKKNLKNSMKNSFIIIGLFIILVAIVVLDALFVFGEGGLLSKKSDVKAPVATIAPDAIPTPTPKEIDVSKVNVQVLNGSGITGEAGRIRDLLKKDGFVISDIGNATKSNYKDTVIKAKKTVDKEIIEKLKKSLSSEKSVGDTEELESSDSSDIIVIVGSKEGK